MRSAAQHLNVMAERLEQIKNRTIEDNSLQILSSVIMKGWPGRNKDIHMEIREYWNFKEELVLKNGIVEWRLVVPRKMRQGILHSGYSWISKFH